MTHDVREIYGAEALLAALPTDRAELFISYTVADEVARDWRAFSRRMRADGERPTARSVWEDPKEQDKRVLIDVTECDSPADAIEALLDRVAENEFARLEEGPAELGSAAFVHPENTPPATYFARGNLCFTVASAGRTGINLEPWLARISADLSQRPRDGAASLSFDREDTTAAPGERITVGYSLRWKLGDDGWLRFTAQGGTLARGDKDRGLIVIPGDTDRVEVEGVAFEGGRQPAVGNLVVPVRRTE